MTLLLLFPARGDLQRLLHEYARAGDDLLALGRS